MRSRLRSSVRSRSRSSVRSGLRCRCDRTDVDRCDLELRLSVRSGLRWSVRRLRLRCDSASSVGSTDFGGGATALALEVHDDAIRVVQRVDAVAGRRLSGRARRACGSSAAARPAPVSRRRQGSGMTASLSVSIGAGVLEIQKHTRGTVDPLVVEGHFLPELDDDAQDLGQHFAGDAGERGRQCGEAGRRRRRRATAAGARCDGRRERGLRVLKTLGLRVRPSALSVLRREARRQRREQAQRHGAIGGVAELPERIGGRARRPARARCRRSRSPETAATCRRRRRPAPARGAARDDCASRCVRAGCLHAAMRSRASASSYSFFGCDVCACAARPVQARPARATDAF